MLMKKNGPHSARQSTTASTTAIRKSIAHLLTLRQEMQATVRGTDQTLPERIRLARLGDLRRQPLVELVRALDRDESAHARVAQAAELRAADLVLELGVAGPAPHLRGGDVGDEPDRDREAGNGVLLHPELRHAEAVDDVLAPEPDDDWLVHRQIELVDGG